MTRFLAMFGILLTCLGSTAAAHLMPRSHGTVRFVGRDVYAAVAIPAAALGFADDTHDGLIDAAEIAHHRKVIGAALMAGFTVSDQGQAAQAETPLVVPGDAAGPSGSTAGAPYVLMLMHSSFARPPVSPVIATTLFGTAPEDTQLALRVSRDTSVELTILTADIPTRPVFQSLGQAFLGFMRTGIMHILSGPDHLLFLLTIVTAAQGWRYWLAVFTSFTVAHSITLTLAAENILRLPPRLTEPAIAASIVVMALLTLRERQRPKSAPSGRTPRIRLLAVFACGLLHGMGFAAALGDMALDGTHRLISLVGFNLGIEAGQIIFLAALGGVAWAARAAGRWWLGAGASRAGVPLSGAVLPGLACAMGMVMLITRLIPG